MKGEVNDTPGEVELPKPITTAEPKRVRGFAIDSKKAVPEHEIALKAFSSNRERLKAERLAREVAGTVVAETKAKPPRRRDK